MKESIIGVFADTMSYSSGSFPNVEKQYVNHRYIQAIDQNGAIPLVIPCIEEKEKLFQLIDRCDGLLFPGGEDVDPKQYSEEPHQSLGEIKPELDEFLIAAIRYAVKTKKPCLGICKGMQLFVVAAGGTLYQDIYSQYETPPLLHNQQAKRDYEIHKVSIDPSSRLCRILGGTEIGTNSMHHQSVKHPGKALRITARTSDGIVEAVEDEDGLLLGVQWHPEEMIVTSRVMNELFKDLIETARRAQKKEGASC